MHSLRCRRSTPRRLCSEAAFAQAIKPYTDAIARNANDAQAHRWLGVAYLVAFKQHRFGLAPHASEFGVRAAESLERSLQRNAEPPVMRALAEAYIVVGAQDKYAVLLDRLGGVAAPISLK